MPNGEEGLWASKRIEVSTDDPGAMGRLGGVCAVKRKEYAKRLQQMLGHADPRAIALEFAKHYLATILHEQRKNGQPVRLTFEEAERGIRMVAERDGIAMTDEVIRNAFTVIQNYIDGGPQYGGTGLRGDDRPPLN